MIWFSDVCDVVLSAGWYTTSRLITISCPNKSEDREHELACPYFMPVEKLEGGNWQHPARLPLGCGWSGHCTAPGHEGASPAQDVLEGFCNLGYAGGCSWAPHERMSDAVRFAVIAPPSLEKRRKEENNRIGLNSIRIRYVCERDHAPVEHGELEFDLQQARWLRHHCDARVQKMAECFLESYLSKSKGNAVLMS